jgi:hypothetical protein
VCSVAVAEGGVWVGGCGWRCLNVECCLSLALLHTFNTMVQFGASCARRMLGRKQRPASSLLLPGRCTEGSTVRVAMLLTVRRRQQCYCYLHGCGAHEKKVRSRECLS